MPMLRMITSRSLETTIAATNSIHRRTQARVMSAVAPANASGARTAAMSRTSLRIIIAAQTMTTEARMTTANSSVAAGLLIVASLAEGELVAEAGDVRAEGVLDDAVAEGVDRAEQGAGGAEGDARSR